MLSCHHTEKGPSHTPILISLKMKLHIKWLTHLLFLTLALTAEATVPLITYSHKLVPRVQKYVNNFSHLPFPLERVKEVTRKLVEPCSSEAYVLVNQPGVTLDDLQDHSTFVFLRTYMFMSSTLGVIPRAEEPLDYDKLSAMIQRKCGAEEVVLNGYDEVETYIDTGKRVIRIDFPPLPEDPEKRKEALMKGDLALKFTLRKLPSPHISVFYTSLEAPRFYNEIDEGRWSKLDIFPDVTKDASRSEEFERNNNVVEEERYFPEKRTNLIDRSLYEGSTFIDADLIAENEMLILGIVLLTAVFLLYQLLCFIGWLLSKAKNQNPLNKEKKPKQETKKTK